jgi:predicted dehydrogenase
MGLPEVVREPPTVALIGGGFIGPVHAEALRRIGATVVGLLGSSPERARPLAERLGIPRVYRDLDELLGDESVTAVHVASPNAAHFDQARRALESGRHVVCEKPLAATSAETATLLALSEARPTQAAAVNYNVRYYPLCQEMRIRIARGFLGRILSVTGSYVQDWLLYPTDYNWRVESQPGANLRAVADIGTHWMDLAQHVTGLKITSVISDLATFHAERFRPQGRSETFQGVGGPPQGAPVSINTDDHAAVLFRMEGETRGSFHVSQVTAGRKNRLTLEVAGTEAALFWDSESPEQLWVGHRGQHNEIVMRDPSLLSADAAGLTDYPGGHAEGFPDTFKQLYRAVYGWVAAGCVGPRRFPGFADGHREVLLCEAIAASAVRGTWVEVEPLAHAAPGG